MVVQITTDFLPAPHVQSAFCPGVTGFHLLCCCVSVRRCSAVLVTQLSTSVPEPGRKHNTLITIDGTLKCAGSALASRLASVPEPDASCDGSALP